MALYHFSMKKDVKPDGTKVKSIDHVDYINREGRFKNSDRQPNNLIRSLNGPIGICDGKNIPIYKSPYGNINITPNGISVSGNASATTVQIALQVAQEAYNGKLSIAGSDRFRDKVVNAAAESSVPIEFASKSLNKLCQERKEQYQDERERNAGLLRRVGNGGILPDYRNGAGVYQPDSYLCSPGVVSLSSLNASDTPRLFELPKLGLVGNEFEEPSMLLQNVAHDKLGDGERSNESVATVRRIVSRSERSKLGERTAREILKNLNAHRDSVLAEAHVEYINREAAFAKKGGCVYTSHRLPKWADDSAKKFFNAADKYEAKNSTRYRELQFALPNELTLEQNVELIEAFIAENIPNQYYAYAIHDKIGAMSDGSRNIHVHIMFSERIIDDVEKEAERAAKNFFSYPKRGDGTNEEKRKAGAPKERYFNSKDFLLEARKSCAEITNRFLRKYDKPDRVDHRSLKAMKYDAEMQGDDYLVQLLSRLPEKYIGLAATLDFESNEQAKALKRFRENKYEFKTKLFEMKMFEYEKEELELQDRFLSVYTTADEIFGSVEYQELDNLEEDDYLVELKKEVMEAKEEASILVSGARWLNDLKEEAAIAFLEEDERTIWRRYRSKENELRKWELFSEGLDNETIKNNLELYKHLNNKLDNIADELREMRPEFQALYEKLSMPVNRDRMQKYIYSQLKTERDYRKNMAAAVNHFEAMMKTFSMALFDETIKDNEKEEFTIKELYSIARKRYYGLKNSFEKAKANRDELRKKVIGKERARVIAENVYTKGKSKKLRELERKLKGSPARLDNNPDIKKDMETLQKEISALMAAPQANERIENIMLGVLEKNKPSVKAYEVAKKYADNLFKDMELAKNDLFIMKDRYEKEKPSTVYKVDGKYSRSVSGRSCYPGGSFSYGSRSNNPVIVAEALKGAAGPGNAVLRLDDKGDKMGTSITDWNLMNVYDKEEILNKRIMRYV